VSGDILKEGLGLSVPDRQMLVEEVGVVINSAASVRFTEPLRVALDINTLGTRKVVQLCNEINQLEVLSLCTFQVAVSQQKLYLQAFVHVSTAYSQAPLSNVDEQVYQPIGDAEVLDKMPQEELEKNEKL